MKDYNIPDDSLEFRFDVFKQLMTPINDYCDGAMDYCVATPIIKNKSLEERLFACFIFSLTYSFSTTLILSEEFSEMKNLKSGNFEKFYNEYQKSLYFSKDRAKLKHLKQVVPSVESVLNVTNGNLSEYVLPNISEGLEPLFKTITKDWKYFGAFGTYLFFDGIQGFCPEIYKSELQIDWKSGNAKRTLIKGIRILLGKDDESLDRPLSQEELDEYEKAVSSWSKEYGWAMNNIESALCFLYKLFKGTRYFGYYADRLLEESYFSEELLKKYSIDVWELREETIPNKFRGELENRWRGIRKERMNRFLLLGEL